MVETSKKNLGWELCHFSSKWRSIDSWEMFF